MGSETAIWLAVDVVGSLALLAAACFALGTGRLRAGFGRLFWFGAAAGLVGLAADERFSLHERAGRWLDGEGVATPFGLNHLDDAVLLSVGASALVFVVVFWREAVESRTFATLLALAALVSAAALAIDGFAPVEGWAPRAEEPVELAGQVILFAAFMRRWIEIREPGVETLPPVSEAVSAIPKDA